MNNISKRLIVLSLIPACLLTSLADAKTPPKKKGKIEIKKAVKPVTAEVFDFRQAKWGMTHQQVQNSEKSGLTVQESERLVYADSLFGINANVSYYFENAMLIKAAYLVEGTFTKHTEYIVNYRKIKKMLKDKYGRPTFDNSNEIDVMDPDMYDNIGELVARGVQELETKWDTNRTQIKLLLKARDEFSPVKLEIGYTSKRLKHLDEVKEVETTKF